MLYVVFILLIMLDNVPAERPEIDYKTCRKSGHSYRQLPLTVFLKLFTLDSSPGLQRER
jgi:hypothetical protein